MSGHTKGPWTINALEHGPWCIDDANADAVGFAQQRGRSGEPDHERTANARLIAAAPELLEALKGATAWMAQEIENIGSCDHAVGICCCGDKAQLASYRDLIAKAEAK